MVHSVLETASNVTFSSLLLWAASPFNMTESPLGWEETHHFSGLGVWSFNSDSPAAV